MIWYFILRNRESDQDFREGNLEIIFKIWESIEFEEQVKK